MKKQEKDNSNLLLYRLQKKKRKKKKQMRQAYNSRFWAHDSMIKCEPREGHMDVVRLEQGIVLALLCQLCLEVNSFVDTFLPFKLS